MDSFRDYLRECMEGVPAINWDPTKLVLSDPMTRDDLNEHLSDITDEVVVHPAVTYEQVRQFLQAEGLHIPPVSLYATEFQDTDGEILLPLVSSENIEEIVYLYFVFAQDELQFSYDVLAEIATADELEGIWDEAEIDEQ